MKTLQKGFTLIELMIVIAIIGILASVALPAYKEYIINAQMSSVMASVVSVKKAVGKNYSDIGLKYLDTSLSSARVGVACAYEPSAVVENCWKQTLGMRASPDADIIEGISSVDIIAGETVTAASVSCTGFLALTEIPTDTIAPAISIQVTFDDVISADLDGLLLYLTPVFNKDRPQNIAWATTTTFDPATDIGGVACKWVQDNQNSQWIK